MSTAIFQLQFWQRERCVVSHQRDCWSKTVTGSTKKIHSPGLSSELPIIKSEYCLKNSKKKKIYVFLVQSKCWCYSCQSEWEKIHFVGRLQHGFSYCSSVGRRCLGYLKKKNNNSVNQVQNLEEKKSFLLPLFKKIKENKIFPIIKNKFPKSIWAFQMFSMWMTHPLYAKILCCYFKTEIPALTFLYVVQRSIVSLLIIYYFIL